MSDILSLLHQLSELSGHEADCADHSPAVHALLDLCSSQAASMHEALVGQLCADSLDFALGVVPPEPVRDYIPVSA